MFKTIFILYLLYSLSFCSQKTVCPEQIMDIKSPDHVEWVSDSTLLIVKGRDIFEYDIDSKELEKRGERKEEEFAGLDSAGELQFCEYENFTIYSPDEFATVFRIMGENGELKKEIWLYETIMPIQMNGKEIIAMTSMPFLEEHFFKIDIESEQIEEIRSPFEEFSFDIPEYIEMNRIFVKDEKNYVIEDMNGNLILYSSLINTYNTIPIFTPIFNAVPIKNPTNDEKPSFILWVKSFFANIYSDIVAPKNAPMKTPKMLPTIPPIIEPSTAPIVPYLEPPEYFVLSVPANSSANVERMDIMKSMMRISGVII